MASINGTKDPKVSKKKTTKKKAAKKKAVTKKKAPAKAAKTAQGTTYLETDAGEKHTTEWVPGCQVDEGVLTANVNVSSGARIGLPNYSDVRCGASLTIPCAATPEDIDAAFEFAKDWVEERVLAMVDENTGGGE